MTTITITNRKGGTGKTTTSVNLAAAWAERGHRVLLIDADPQAHSSLSLGCSRETKPGLFEALTTRMPIAKTVRQTGRPNLALTSGGARLSDFERDYARDRRSRTALLAGLRDLQGEIDVVVIDTPPTLRLLTVSSLIASSAVLVPVQAHFLALEGLAETIRALRRVEAATRRKISFFGVVPTFFQPAARLPRAVLADMRQTLGENAVLSPIRSSIGLAEAPSHGKSIFEYDARSNGARDYLRLSEEIESRLGSLCTVEAECE